MKKEKNFTSFTTLVEISQSIASGGKMPCNVASQNSNASYIAKTRGTIFDENRSNEVMKIEKMV